MYNIIYQSICLPIYLSIYLSFYLSIYLSSQLLQSHGLHLDKCSGGLGRMTCINLLSVFEKRAKQFALKFFRDTPVFEPTHDCLSIRAT